MKSIEISARTVAEAVELALEQLKRDRDEVAIAVLDSGEDGDEALVRVSVVEEDEDDTEKDIVKKVVAPKKVAADDQSEDEKIVSIARLFLEELLQHMDIHAYVTAVKTRVPDQHGESEEETVTLHIEGADEQAMGLMIGRRGETLHSLQFLLNMLVSRRVHRWPHLVIDVGNYRQRRREALEGLAYRMADRVKETGRSIVLEPMAAYERRIVHLALRNNSLVYTQSTGEGENRKIVIYPK